MKHRKLNRLPLFLLKHLLILAVTGLIVMMLWNALIPSLFNGPQLSYWQSAGLLILSKILFGTIGRGFGKRHHHYPDEMWKQKLKAKYNAMTPEEKEKFRTKCRSRFSSLDIEEENETQGESNTQNKI